MKLTGKGFGNLDYVVLYIDSLNSGISITSGADRNGNISQVITIPASVVQGPHTLIADSYSLNETYSVPVTFMPQINAMVGHSGLSVQVNGAAFNANENVSIYWGTAKGQFEGTSTTDSTGNLSFSFAAPSGLSDGTYPVTVVRSGQKPATVGNLFKVIPITMTSTPGIRSGQQVKVKLTGFLANETVNINWDANGGQILTSLYTNNSGAATGSFTPPSAPLGTYTLTASDSSGLQTSNSLSVGPGISKVDGIPDQQISVTGGGFAPNENVTVYFQNPGKHEVTAMTDSTGAFNATLTTPTTYKTNRNYYIYAVATTGSDHARAPFIFLQPSLSICGNDCSTVTYGEYLSLQAANFGYNEKVKIVWNYQQADQYVLDTVQASGGNVYLSTTAPSSPNTNVTVAAIGETSHMIVTQTVANTAALSIVTSTIPPSGKPGTKIKLQGGSFGANDPVTLTMQGKIVATVNTQSDGALSTTITAPTDIGAGNVAIIATDATANISAQTYFYYVPTLSVTRGIVHPGDSIVISGKHFASQGTVFIYYPDATPYPYVAAVANTNGAFSTTIPISASLASGTYYISAEDVTSGQYVTIQIIVQ